MLTFVVPLLVYIVCLLTPSAEQKELRLLGLQPMSGEAWPGGWSCLVPVRMAVESINARPDLLQGYTLKYDYVDHEVSSRNLSYFVVGCTIYNVC